MEFKTHRSVTVHEIIISRIIKMMIVVTQMEEAQNSI